MSSLSLPAGLTVAFALPDPVAVTPLGTGHINVTLLATYADGQQWVHQRINESVFRVAAVHANFARITAHLRSRGVATLEHRRTAAGRRSWRDREGGSWRTLAFLSGTREPALDAGLGTIRACAEAFGRFAAALVDLPEPALRDTIPRFHDLARRAGALDASLRRDRLERARADTQVAATAAHAKTLIEAVLSLLEREGVARLPTRVVHNDAKLANVLVDTGRQMPVCVVDLDTAMSGPLLHDAGELIRSASHTFAEDDDAVTIDPARYRAVVDGYVSGLGATASDSETASLALGGLYLSLENGVRFLTDHLDGDRYFRIAAPGQNLARARAQLALAQQLWQNHSDLRDLWVERARG